MEISTLIAGTSFGAVLASLAVAPNLIGIFLERRSKKLDEGVQNRVAAVSSPTPFNYPQIFVAEVPITSLPARKKGDNPVKTVDGLLPFSAPVPFNYPSLSVRKAGSSAKKSI